MEPLLSRQPQLVCIHECSERPRHVTAPHSQAVTPAPSSMSSLSPGQCDLDVCFRQHLMVTYPQHSNLLGVSGLTLALCMEKLLLPKLGKAVAGLIVGTLPSGLPQPLLGPLLSTDRPFSPLSLLLNNLIICFSKMVKRPIQKGKGN